MRRLVANFKWFVIIPLLLVYGCSGNQRDIVDELGLPSLRTDIFLDESHGNLSIPPGLQRNFKRKNQDPNSEVQGITIVRDGKRAWLALGIPPRLVWTQILKFLDKQGFRVEYKEPLEFYLRTAWRTRNTAKKGSTRLTFQVSYSIRLERDVDSFTNVFVTAREIVANEHNITVIPDSSNAENKLLAALINDIKQTQRIFSENIVLTSVGYPLLLRSIGNAHILLIGQNINLVWNRLGGTLERAGFTQVKRRKAENTIVVIPQNMQKGNAQPLRPQQPWIIKVQPGKIQTIVSITPTDREYAKSAINRLQEIYLDKIRNAY